MLTPTYLAGCSDPVLGIYDNLQTAVSQDIAKSLVKHGELITSNDWQIKRLQESGILMQDVVQQVAQISGYSEKAVRKAFEDAAKKSMYNDAAPLIEAKTITGEAVKMSAAQLNVLNATIAKTNGNLRNLTKTAGATARGLYMQEANTAYMRVASGTASPQKAIADAIRNAAREGSYVLYGQRANGSYVRSPLDVAVRRAVMTGINQTCGQLTEMWADDMGCEYYEVSAHLGARPSHQEWEGQVYKIDGSDAHYKNFYEETGYGTGDGLCGYNCRHSFYPFWPGISKSNYSKEKLEQMHNKSYDYNGQELSEYECSQKQREYERDIRATKRELASYEAAMDATTDKATKAELKTAFNNQSIRLKNTEREMKAFCSATNRRTDSSRTQVVAYKDSSGRIVNFGHSAAMKAVWADRKSR